MNKELLVSVIMNFYNVKKYLGEDIHSIYSQTYKIFGIIFLVKASTDYSGHIAKSYDAKLKYFYEKKNTVLSLVRILAVNEANGEYLIFLNCDDFWNREKFNDY